MEMIDVGTKRNYGPEAKIEDLDKDKVNYPDIYGLEKFPEELWDKEIGSECRIEVVVKIKSKLMDERDDDKGKKKTMTLEIRKMGYKGDAGRKTKEEYLSMSDDEREKYDNEGE